METFSNPTSKLHLINFETATKHLCLSFQCSLEFPCVPRIHYEFSSNPRRIRSQISIELILEFLYNPLQIIVMKNSRSSCSHLYLHSLRLTEGNLLPIFYSIDFYAVSSNHVKLLMKNSKRCCCRYFTRNVLSVKGGGTSPSRKHGPVYLHRRQGCDLKLLMKKSRSSCYSLHCIPLVSSMGWRGRYQGQFLRVGDLFYFCHSKTSFC